MQKNQRLDDLSHAFSELIHNWGFKRIHGRIWSRLFLSSRALDAADLIECLGISKALVSISLRELLDVKAVEEVGRSDRGTHLFKANPDLSAIYLELLKKRESQLLDQTSIALRAVQTLDENELHAAAISLEQVATLAAHLQSATAFVNDYVIQRESAFEGVVSFASAKEAIQNQFKAASSLDSQSAMVLPAHGG